MSFPNNKTNHTNRLASITLASTQGNDMKLFPKKNILKID